MDNQIYTRDASHADLLRARAYDVRGHAPEAVPTGIRFAELRGNCVITAIVGATWDSRACVYAGPYAQGTAYTAETIAEIDADWERAKAWVRAAQP
ncbi:MAG TPA: hypothetical protein VFT22_31145 [Kofleriaceae bacterium]|nr:hypothetical protein [Kofleriaceae bacterium]